MRVNKVEKKKKHTNNNLMRPAFVLREEVSEKMLRQRVLQTQEQQRAEGQIWLETKAFSCGGNTKDTASWMQIWKGRYVTFIYNAG